MPTTSRRKLVLLLIAIALPAIVAVPLAMGAMKSERLGKRLCVTTGGGKFVDIPGFPGERIDRRLLRDVRFLVRRYKIFITDGFSTDPVHSPHGEHPRGLALDIVPNRAAGGTWKDVSRLARWAEPKQNQPRAPFRWVGYNGDPGHGRGHHLHLSWAHSGSPFGKPAKTVYTIRCPKRKKAGGGGGGDTGGGGGDGSATPEKSGTKPTGGVSAKGGVPGASSGGASARRLASAKRKVRAKRNRSRESGGVGIR